MMPQSGPTASHMDVQMDTRSHLLGYVLRCHVSLVFETHVLTLGTAQSAQRERAIQQAIDKARENDNVRLSYFEFLRRGGQSANTIQDIVIFLESYRNIDGVGPTTQENPEQFEDGYGRDNDLPF